MTTLTPTELHSYASRQFDIVVEECQRLSEYTMTVINNTTRQPLEVVDCSHDELYDVRDRLIYKYLLFNFRINL